MADIGHPRAQNPPAQWQALNTRANLFLREHIGGSHEQRHRRLEPADRVPR